MGSEKSETSTSSNCSSTNSLAKSPSRKQQTSKMRIKPLLTNLANGGEMGLDVGEALTILKLQVHATNNDTPVRKPKRRNDRLI